MRVRLPAVAFLLFAALPVHAGDAPVCGDVNKSNSVSTTDALIVLKKGVGQEVTLDCSQFTDVIASCQTDLSGCEADLASCESATYCGDGTIDDGEQCDSGNLDGQSCVGLGFLGGELACTAACALSTEGCESPRFEVTARGTILDHQTGLEWEKKDASDDIANLANPHDADNKYQWSGAALAGPDGSAFLVFLPAPPATAAARLARPRNAPTTRPPSSSRAALATRRAVSKSWTPWSRSASASTSRAPWEAPVSAARCTTSRAFARGSPRPRRRRMRPLRISAARVRASSRGDELAAAPMIGVPP